VKAWILLLAVFCPLKRYSKKITSNFLFQIFHQRESFFSLFSKGVNLGKQFLKVLPTDDVMQ